MSRLTSSQLADEAKADDVYQAGDILVIWSNPQGSDAHVMVALEHQGSKLVSAEYGQPGGAVRVHELVKPGWVGQRKIHKVLRLMTVMKDAEDQEKLLEPDYTTLPIAQAYGAEHADQT